MQFTITYRDAGGAMREEAVEAASRAEALAEYRRRGISPMRIVELSAAKMAAVPVSSHPRGRAQGRNSAANGNSSFPHPVHRSLGGGGFHIFTIAAVAAVAAIAAWWCLGRAGARPSQPAPAARPSQPTNYQLPTNQLPTAPATNAAAAKRQKLRTWEYPAERTNELSEAQLRKWHVMRRAPPGYTNDTSRTEAPPKYAIFRHNSENEIACLLTMTPGDTLVGTPIYTRKFTEDFLKSLETPIVVSEEDSPEDAELKRAMVQTKIALKERIDAGEDLGKILLDTRREYQELSRYKMALQREFSELKNNPDVTMQDVDDFLAAANQMLEQKGVAPLKLGPISRRMLMKRKGAAKEQ